MSDADELKYTQKDMDFVQDNTDEYFNKWLVCQKIAKELLDTLIRERGAGLPLPGADYVRLLARAKEILGD